MRTFLLLLMLLVSGLSWAAPPPAKPELRLELLSMEKIDQELRKATPVDVKAVKSADARNTERMKQIIESNGWPSEAWVGKDGAHAAWLLVQHADADPEFQVKALKLMRPLLKRGEIERQSYAYLWDRVHSPQRYGTQGSCVSKTEWRPDKIKAAGSVDARRKKMDMPPIAEYISMASQHMCARWEPRP